MTGEARAFQFDPQNTYSFVFYADSTSAEARAIRAVQVQQAVRTRIQTLGGQVLDVKADVTPKTGDTTTAVRIAGWTPRAPTTRADVDREMLAALDTIVPDRVRWVPHVPGSRNTAIALTIGLPVLVVGLVSTTAREAMERQYRQRLGYIVDANTIESGTNREPPPSSSSALGRAGAIVAGDRVSSTEPSRDGQTPAQTAAADAAAVVGTVAAPSPAIIVGAIIGVSLLAIVGVGYAARGLATLKKG